MPRAERVRVRQGVRSYRQPDGFEIPIGARVRDPVTDESGYFGGCWRNPNFGLWMCELRSWRGSEGRADTVFLNVELPEARAILDRLVTYGGRLGSRERAAS